jgi:hypothetical protein
MSDPKQITKELWQIADRCARDAMAEIADAQMKTWAKFPPVDGPTDFIRSAILQAMEVAGRDHLRLLPSTPSQPFSHVED